MAIKFNSGKVRLWKSAENSQRVGVGIKFGKNAKKAEVGEIHKAIQVILTLKYGKGKK